MIRLWGEDVLLRHLLPYGQEFDRAVWIRFWGEIATSAAVSMIFPFLTIYLYDRLETTRTLVGLIVGIAPLAQTIGGIAGGFLADRWGRRRVMVGSLLLQGLFTWGFILACDVASFALVTALQSFFGALYRPAANAMVADVTPEEKRAQAYGLMRIAGNAGVAVGPLMGAAVFMLSPAVVFGLTGIILLVFAGFVVKCMPETAPLTGEPSRETGWKREAKAYINILRQETVCLFIVLNIILGICISQFYTSLPLYLKEDLGHTAGTFAILVSLNAVMVVVLQMRIARQTEYAPVGRTLAIGATLFGLGLAGFALNASMPVLVTTTMIFTVGEIYHAPSSMKYLVTIAPADQRGRYLGLDALRTLGMMAGPVMGGALMDRFGGPSAFLAGGALALVAAALFLQMGRQIARHNAQKTTTHHGTSGVGR